MLHYAKIALLSLMTFSLAGCATIVNGPHQAIGITSNPTGANVFVDQLYVGTTPSILKLTRCDTHMLRIELDGFQSYELVLTKGVSGWIFGNFVTPFVVLGLVIDAVTGSVYKLTPDQVHAQLRENAVCSSKDNDSFIFVVLEADSTWEKVGNLIANN